MLPGYASPNRDWPTSRINHIPVHGQVDSLVVLISNQHDLSPLGRPPNMPEGFARLNKDGTSLPFGSLPPVNSCSNLLRSDTPCTKKVCWKTMM